MWIAALVSTDENCVVKVGRLRAMTNGRSGYGGWGPGHGGDPVSLMCGHALSPFRSPQSSVHPNFVSGIYPSSRLRPTFWYGNEVLPLDGCAGGNFYCAF